MLGLFVQPRHQVVISPDFLIALHRASKEQRFDPVAAEMLQDRPCAGHVGQSRGAHHAAGNHEGRMRPLPAKQGIDFYRAARNGHTRFIGGPCEGRIALHRFFVELGLRIVLVGVVDHEQAIMMARDRLDGFDDLPEVAGENGVARNGRTPGSVKRPCRTGKVRGTADSASTRRNDKPGLWILVLEDDLEAAEHFRLRPCIGDDPVLDVDTDIKVALHPANGRDVEGLCSCHCNSPEILCAARFAARHEPS